VSFSSTGLYNIVQFRAVRIHDRHGDLRVPEKENHVDRGALHELGTSRGLIIQFIESKDHDYSMFEPFWPSQEEGDCAGGAPIPPGVWRPSAGTMSSYR
jgi:hypothetical protein